MQVETIARFTRSMIQGRPDALFLFGDNMAGIGRGGQARECRDEPNAVGVPTKWYPSMQPHSFFRETDAANPRVVGRINGAFDRAEAHLRAGGVVVLPADGIGTGLAQLPTRAPAVYAIIARRIDQMRALAKNTPDDR